MIIIIIIYEFNNLEIYKIKFKKNSINTYWSKFSPFSFQNWLRIYWEEPEVFVCPVF